MEAAVRWWDRHQVPLYLAAIILGALAGVGAPAAAPALQAAITPVLGLLLFATFLGVPLAALGRGLREPRFLGTLLVVNFVAAPVVVFALSRLVAGDTGLLLGVLLVLLAPCVDYVIVFTGLAGGAKDRLLAAAPLLMLLQVALLPLYLWLFAGPAAVSSIRLAPFGEAFVVLILVPLAAAAAVQAFSNGRSGGRQGGRPAAPPAGAPASFARAIEATASAAMVPLMMATLGVVVASQVAVVGSRLPTLLPLVPLYAAFALVMAAIGLAAGRIARIDIPGIRAVMFSGSTRNSLVVLPLALALPAGFAIAPLAVVTQTLVELVLMVVFVRVVPLATGGTPAAGATTPSPTASH